MTLKFSNVDEEHASKALNLYSVKNACSASFASESWRNKFVSPFTTHDWQSVKRKGIISMAFPHSKSFSNGISYKSRSFAAENLGSELSDLECYRKQAFGNVLPQKKKKRRCDTQTRSLDTRIYFHSTE